MNAEAASLALRLEMPRRVRFALAMLWIAWSVSAGALLAHLYSTHGLGADLYSIIATPAALLQSLLIYLVGRRSNAARILLFLMAIPAFLVAAMLFSTEVSSLRLALEASLRGPALLLLLTPRAAQWFTHSQVPM
jgi:hypothetical protein